MTAPGSTWGRLRAAVEERLRSSLTNVAVPVNDPPEVLSRRRKVVIGTSLAGAGLLGISLSAEPGSSKFYVLTMGTAAAWTLGGLASGPLHLGWVEGGDSNLHRPVATPIATGVAAFGFFYGGALVVRRIPFLRRAIGSVLQFAEQGHMPLVLLSTYANGVGEEIFFRGAMYAALPSREAMLASTGIYALATTATRNPSLVLASLVMGPLWAMQRRASGGVQAPLLTHMVWSTLMVRFLPPLFRDDPDATS
jgi:membrane protease YdiL (CAAX protease family)